MDPIHNEVLSSDSSHSSGVSDDGYIVESRERLKYKCDYCPKKFTTTQARGRHHRACVWDKDLMTRQGHLMMQHIYLANLVQRPYPQIPNQYSVPPGFEIPRFRVCDTADHYEYFNEDVTACRSSMTSLQIDPNHGMMGHNWTPAENPFQPAMVQSQPQPSPVNLDLYLGIGSSSQVQAWPKKPTGATKVAVEKEDDPLSLKL